MSRCRKPCEHGRYDPHSFDYEMYPAAGYSCPGGEFLADDALKVIAQTLSDNCFDHNCKYTHHRAQAAAILDAFTVREGA